MIHKIVSKFNFQALEKKFSCELNQDLTQKTFSKKSISQLCVIEELNCLICICDGVPRIHSLSQGLKEIVQLGNKSVSFKILKKKGYL